MVILLSCVFLIYFVIVHGTTERFEKVKWFANAEKRFYMADDIIKSEILINKDSNQVKEILGDPTSRNPVFPVWYYHMGWGSGGLGFLKHDLAVRFDNKRVIKVEHGKTP